MIHSMTAFASGTLQDTWGYISWEIRSVNHRFLDCSMKLPEMFKGLEMELRDVLRQKIQRGRIECNLQYRPIGLACGGGGAIDINTTLVQELAAACNTVKQFFLEAKSPNPLQILSWPGVLQTKEDSLTTLNSAVITLFTQTVTRLLDNRNREGEALKQLLETKLRSIAASTQQIKARFPEVLAAQRAKLLDKLREIRATLDTNRLEQEMVFFAQKIDICEEIERLETHIVEMQAALQLKEMVGKRLDFLLQEFNRETNTTMSKSVDAEITKIAMNVKVLIEQMREQVQNIE